MPTVVFTAYVAWWFYTYGCRWKSRAMFWRIWLADAVVLLLATNRVLSQCMPCGVHCLLAIVGFLSPVFLSQCHTSPFQEE